MQKRVFIIHGWDGYPEEGWFPWLKKELEKRGFVAKVPKMPDAKEPKINKWVNRLQKAVGKVDENTFFVGHSIGCQAILRYFESLGKNEKAGGAVFAAGWLTLINLETAKERKIAKPWLEIPINFHYVLRHSKKFFYIFSDNDYFVPPGNKKIFRNKLKARIIIEHKKGHFSADDGIEKLPSALKAVLEIAGRKR
jgi:uncharacterized protein